MPYDPNDTDLEAAYAEQLAALNAVEDPQLKRLLKEEMQMELEIRKQQEMEDVLAKSNLEHEENIRVLRRFANHALDHEDVSAFEAVLTLLRVEGYML